MKYLLALSFFTLISCGGDQVPEDMAATIGDVRTLKADDNLLDPEKEDFLSICQAIDAQKDYLEQYIVPPSRSIQLSAGSKGCSETTPTVTTINEVVTLENGNLVMSGAPFKNVLTTNSALIKDFCSKLTADITQQVARGYQLGSRGRWFAVYKGQHQKCNKPNGNKDEVCLYMETGVKNTDNANSFIIQDVEVFKVSLKTNEDTYGVVMNRTLATSATCSTDGEKYYKGQAFVQFNP